MKRFKRTVEDFVCEHCGIETFGDGYTNHCPVCLWSKHVDNQPGDREAACRGLMQPVRVETNRGKSRLVHRCNRCGIEKVVDSHQNDNFEQIIAIAKSQ